MRAVLLTAQEEHDLAVAWRERGEKAARNRLISCNLALVASIVKRRYSRPGYDFDDLLQEGCQGLMRAIDGFDPSAGTRLSTYAVPWIQSFVSRFMAQEASGVVRLGGHLQEITDKISLIRQELSAGATLIEIARKIGVSASRLVNVWPFVGQGRHSLDDEIRGSNQAGRKVSLGEVIAAEGPTPEDIASSSQEAVQLEQALATLTRRERTVIRLRYFEELTLLDAAAVLGRMEERELSRERVRQIEVQALGKLHLAALTLKRRFFVPEVATTRQGGDQ